MRLSSGHVLCHDNVFWNIYLNGFKRLRGIEAGCLIGCDCHKAIVVSVRAFVPGSILTTCNDRPSSSCGFGSSRELIKKRHNSWEEHESLCDDFHFEASDFGLCDLLSLNKIEEQGQ